MGSSERAPKAVAELSARVKTFVPGPAVRQDGGLRTSAPARALIGPSGGPSRRVADPSERRGAQSAAGEGRWTQVRPCPAFGSCGWRSPSPWVAGDMPSAAWEPGSGVVGVRPRAERTEMATVGRPARI